MGVQVTRNPQSTPGSRSTGKEDRARKRGVKGAEEERRAGNCADMRARTHDHARARTHHVNNMGADVDEKFI